ncbi:MAG: hypothetical protein E4H44_01115 [Candidatus Aminicenantes bacterium]|nr:MAG: hypothetical protein E4H44_01115 [Candidatus Aminicenantes bacterium]
MTSIRCAGGTRSRPLPFTLLVTVAVASMVAGSTAVHSASRVVVVGEVQGAANSAVTLLQKVELVDGESHWSGGDAVLIQTGDLIDGGEHARAAMDLFMRLQEEAAAAGGRVIVLMGNHEAMNILGELRDVNYMTYAAFAGPDAEARQKAHYDAEVAWHTERAAATGSQFTPDDEFNADWFALHPPGWVEYVEAMRPEGTYGRWLRTLPVAVELNGVLFVHAGISPEMKRMTIEEINNRAAEEIRRFDADRDRMVAEGMCLPLCSARQMVDVINGEITYLNTLDASQRNQGNPRMTRAADLQHLGQWGSWSVLTDTGPLWFKGTSQWDEKQHGGEMNDILTVAGVERMVTGQSDGKDHVIHTRFDNRVILTSVDMSDDPWDGGGTPAALEIVDDDFVVVTMKGREVLIASN